MQVYEITNKINGKKYIGQHVGKNLNSYWKENVRYATIGPNKKPALYAAIRKYGPAAFEVRTLVIVGSKEQMDYYEIKLIEKLNCRHPSGYNLNEGGGGSFNPTQEVRDKIRNSKIGRKRPPSVGKAVAEANRNRVWSEETKHRVSEARKGINLHGPMSEEGKQKLSLLKKGVKLSEETKRRMRASWTPERRRAHHQRNLDMSIYDKMRKTRGLSKESAQ